MLKHSRTHMAGTQWYMKYGERKLTADANDGAPILLGNWKPGAQYVFGGYLAVSPAGLPDWDDSFFISCGASPTSTTLYIMFDHGGGELLSNTLVSFMLFPGTKWVSGCTDLIYGIPVAIPGLFDFILNFRADGKIFKQWQGNGNGNDWYLLIAEKSI